MYKELIAAIYRDFGIAVATQQQTESYFKRVWKIEDSSGKNLVVKLLPDANEYQLKHPKAEVAFAQEVNSKMQSLQTVEFIPDKNGVILHRIIPDKNDYYVLMDYHSIIRKKEITPSEQRHLGTVMAEMHRGLIDFHHEGIGGTYYMRETDEEDMGVIREAFPDEGYKPYLKYMQPLDYGELELQITTLHGDWHDQNMSFTDPSFLFDLDTVCRGAGSEEIARTLTHWAIAPEKIKEFYENLAEGYALSANERRLVPLFMVTQLYRKYAEFNKYKDPQSMEDVKRKIPTIKEAFALP